MSTIIEILRNLGTIVILLFQIGYVSIVDYIRPQDNAKPKQSNIKNKTASKDVCWDSSKYSKSKPLYKRTRRLDVSSNKEHEVVHERPHYKN